MTISFSMDGQPGKVLKNHHFSKRYSPLFPCLEVYPSPSLINWGSPLILISITKEVIQNGIIK